VSDQLLTLLHSPSAAVRERVVRSLNSGWVSTEIARDLGRKALEDDSPQVRSAAVRLLRERSQT
jgi:HEAT repeat protein